MQNNIPKIIHYCWFGSRELPDDAKRCIESWRKFMPDYEIRRWDESNFDVNEIAYTSEAYAAGKYAFVSDYARFKILYEYGGIYFDTDVEVIKPFEDIVLGGPFMGFEINPRSKGARSLNGLVNPGLGLGVTQTHFLYKEILDQYRTLNFLNPDGSLNQKTVVAYTTEILIRHGLNAVAGIQNVAGIKIYPQDYFNPYDTNTGRLRITPNSHSIHWYSKTWIIESKFRRKLSQLSHRLLGTTLVPSIKKHLRLSKN